MVVWPLLWELVIPLLPLGLERMARWAGIAIHHVCIDASNFATKANTPQFTGEKSFTA